MFTEVAPGLVLHLDQGLLEDLPAEDVDTHGSQVASGNRRLLLEFRDAVGLVRNQDAETAGLLNRNRHSSNGDISVVGLVIIQHNFIIHLVDMVTGQNQNVIRIIILHILQILVDRVRGSGVPVAPLTALVGRQDCYAAHIAVQIPRDPNPDMGVQT